MSDQDLVTIEDIAKACVLATRSVHRWLRRLALRPVRLAGPVHLFEPDVVPTIQAAMIRAADARKEAIAAAKRRPAIISVKEARRRAKGGAK